MMRQPINTLVVEDEPLARKKLVRLLSRDDEINVTAAVATVDDAVRLDPLAGLDLVLLDIRLPGANGFALLQELQRRGIDPFVVFVTASSEHAISAFEVEAVDYVLKPFSADRFTKAIDRAKEAIRRADDHEENSVQNTELRPTAQQHTKRFPGRLLLSDNGRVLFLPTHLIEFIQAAGRTVKVFAQGECHTIREPLHEIEARLDASHFVRIHRSTIVNIEHIVEMHALFHGNCELVMKRGTRLTLSRRFRNRMAPFLAGSWPT
jgi:two-component system, LytTR family, response regulator